MAGKKSIDEIWKELNAKPAPRASVIGVAGVLPSQQQRPAVAAVKPVKAPAPAGVEDVPLVPAADLARPAGAPAPLAYDPAKAGVSADELQAYVSGIQRLINCLSDPDRNTRRGAVITLTGKLLTGDASTSKASAPLLQAVVCGPLLHPVTALFGDVVDKTRATALQLVTDAAGAIADPGALLPALMPALLRRMGRLPVEEQVEEIRLQIVTLVALAVSRVPPKLLVSHTADVSTVLCRALEDPFHDIKKAACGCLAALCAKVPADSLEGSCEKLVAALNANLQHPHSRVRHAVVQALDALVSSAAVSTTLIESSVAAGIRPAAYDRAPNVREALFDAVAHWLGGRPPAVAALAAGGSGAAATANGTTTANASGSAGDAGVRARAAAPVLLPLLLVGLTDPQESVAARALELVESAGAAWDQQQRQQGSISSMDVDGAAAAASSASQQQPQASGAGGDDAVMTDTASTSGTVSEAESAAVAAVPLPPPYKGRPSAASRRMVAALLPRMLPPVVKELHEWTVSLRACGARSLYTMLVFAEAAATSHLQQLVPALCSAVGDEDADVARYIVSSVQALGAHVPATRWLPLALDHLASAKLSLVQKTNALVVLAGLLAAAAQAKQAPQPELVAALVSALTAEDVRGADHPALRLQLLAVVCNTMRWIGPLAVGVSGPLYCGLLQLYGFEKDASRQASITAAMGQLATLCGHADQDALSDAHAAALLPGVCDDAPRWSADSSNFHVFRALLLTSSGATVGALLPRAAAVMHAALEDKERDANLQLAMLQLVDQLLESDRTYSAFGGSAAAGGGAAAAEQQQQQQQQQRAALTLTRILLPPLVWRPGKSAAAVRFAAVTALATFLRRELAPQDVLMGLISAGQLLPPLYQCLDEDWYADVRLTSCYVVERLLRIVGPSLTEDHRRSIYPELLKRLDDSNNAVRVAVCKALVSFADTLSPSYCDTNTGYLAAGVIIHMDDSDAAVQEAACSAMVALARAKPGPVRKEVDKVRDRFRSKQYCDRVLGACDGGVALAS